MSNKYEGKLVLLILSKVQSFLNHPLNLRDTKPNSSYNLNLNVPLIATVIAIVQKALY